MSMLALLLAISAIEWYIIDNLKEKIWGNLSWGNYITIAVSLLASFALAFSFICSIAPKSAFSLYSSVASPMPSMPSSV